jgi:hypothetical protein
MFCVKWLTKQEITVALMVLFLLLTGLAVKTYRIANAPSDPLPTTSHNQ